MDPLKGMTREEAREWVEAARCATPGTLVGTQPWETLLALAALGASFVGEDAVERIAALEHEQWMAWSKALCTSESISAERRDRWKALWVPYSELSEEMKDFDRKWARLVLKEGE